MFYNICNVRQIKSKDGKIITLVDICCSNDKGSCVVTRFLPNELYDTYKQYLAEGSTKIAEDDIDITIRNNDLYIDFSL